VLDEIEIVKSKIHGYGTATFGRNLSECYHHLVERDVRQDDLSTIMSFAERILDHPMELISGVEETLEYLSLRHELTLMTKGNPEEQKLKLDRSGLAIYFGHTAIVKEKNEASYSDMVRERELELSRTWMIGNSPKSDINPALAAGLNAVFIPHPHTWRLERAEVSNGGRGKLIEVERFVDLQQHF
jgi:putative hydrolase of the HAD superfamily